MRPPLLLTALLLSFFECNEGQDPYPDIQFYTSNLPATILQQLTYSMSIVATTNLFENQKCCANLGCFDNGGRTHYLLGLPDCNFMETKFYLTNSAKPSVTRVLPYNNAGLLERSGYDKKCPSVYIIHGYTESAKIKWMKEMKDALLRKYRNSCVNVIRVGYEEISNFLYTDMSRHAELIGRRIGFFIGMTVQLMGANPDDIHLVGFSLGGMITGYAGQFLLTKNISVGRITALDPAGPGFCSFSQFSAGYKLNQSHAQYVMVIHTNGGNILQLQMGCMEPLGHVDYYPNGGQEQPTCKTSIYGLFGCNHMCAHAYFTRSISNENCFRSFPAADYTKFKEYVPSKSTNAIGNMGFYSVTTKAKGIQFLKTSDHAPYCGSQFRIEATTKRPAIPTFSVTLSDGTFSTEKMSVHATRSTHITNIIVSTIARLNFAAGRVITAKFSTNLSLKSLVITNEDGLSKYYCNNNAKSTVPAAKFRIKLDDNKC